MGAKGSKTSAQVSRAVPTMPPAASRAFDNLPEAVLQNIRVAANGVPALAQTPQWVMQVTRAAIVETMQADWHVLMAGIGAWAVNVAFPADALAFAPAAMATGRNKFTANKTKPSGTKLLSINYSLGNLNTASTLKSQVYKDEYCGLCI